MSDYERFAMVLDSETALLGGCAIRLLELGIDVLYTNDVDEAALLARQESQRLGAVLIPATFDRASVDALLSRVCSQLEVGSQGVIVAGAAPAAELIEYLRARGVAWCLWDPYEMRELRFVMAAAMSTKHTSERRKHLRIPIEMQTTVFMGRHRKDVTVHDLSQGGAYFATPHPFLEGSQLRVELPLPGGSVMGKAEVVNAKTADKPGRADVPEGMGVAFREFAPDADAALGRFIDDWIGRFRI
jgi:hypothetical protein